MKKEYKKNTKGIGGKEEKTPSTHYTSTHYKKSQISVITK
jgi:hypothetical protein